MADPVVTNTVTNTPNKIPTSQAVVNYVAAHSGSGSGEVPARAESLDNKQTSDTSFDVTSDVMYPSNKAVADLIDSDIDMMLYSLATEINSL